MGAAAKEAVPALIGMMTRGKGRFDAAHATQALGRIGAAAVPALVTLLKDGRALAAIPIQRVTPKPEK